MDVTKEAQQHIINTELTVARNTVYLFEVRARVAKQIGDDAGLEAAKKEMEKWVKAVDELEKMLKEIE